MNKFGYRVFLLVAAGMAGLSTTYGQEPASQPATGVKQPPLRWRIGFGQRAADSVRRAFVTASGLRHQFGRFYSSVWVAGRCSPLRMGTAKAKAAIGG